MREIIIAMVKISSNQLEHNQGMSTDVILAKWKKCHTKKYVCEYFMNLHIKSNKVKAHALLLCHGVPGVGNGSFVTRALDSVTREADRFGSPQNHGVGIALLGSLTTTINKDS